MNKDEIKVALWCCSDVNFETSCIDCPYRYRCKDLDRDALDIITKQEKEIERLKIERNMLAEALAKEQEACFKCEFVEKLKARITRFIWRHNLPECIFNDIMGDLLKVYEKRKNIYRRYVMKNVNKGKKDI